MVSRISEISGRSRVSVFYTIYVLMSKKNFLKGHLTFAAKNKIKFTTHKSFWLIRTVTCLVSLINDSDPGDDNGSGERIQLTDCPLAGPFPRLENLRRDEASSSSTLSMDRAEITSPVSKLAMVATP